MKQLAAHLALPVFIVDAESTLVLYDEPAEAVLGCRYEETGEMPVGAFEVRGATVTADLVCHPGPTVGYRVDDGPAVATYLPVHEPVFALGEPRPDPVDVRLGQLA